MITKRQIRDIEKKTGTRQISFRREYNNQLIAGGKKISLAEIYNALEEFHQNKKGSREWKNSRANSITNSNLKNEGNNKFNYAISGSFSGQLGLVHSWTDPFAMCSKLTRTVDGTPLCQMLTRYMRQNYPNFQFTSICVNRNWPGTLHVDKNNLGESKMLTVSSPNMTGGDLYLHTLKGGGKMLKTNNRVITFNGNDPHMTQPYKGTRYSIVYYTTSLGIKPTRRKKLKKLYYFNPPKSRSFVSLKMRQGELPVKERMALAAADLKNNFPSLYRTYLKRQGGNNEEIRNKYRKDYDKYHGYDGRARQKKKRK